MIVYSVLFSILNLIWVIEIRVWQKEGIPKVNARKKPLNAKTQIAKIIISIKNFNYFILKHQR